MALGHWADRLSTATKQFILDRELEEMTGGRHVVRQPGKTVEPVQQSRARGRAGVDRWRMRIDLRWPSPIAISRPKSDDGATSFHMRVETVSRSAERTSGEGAASSGLGNGASRFDTYVTDGLTPAQVDASRFDRYASDAEVVSVPSDPEVEGGTRVAFVITNIDADPGRREAFWQARHEAARKRGDHVIELVPTLGSIEQWRALQRDDELPPRVREGITQVLMALEAANHAGRPARTVKTQRIRIGSAAELAWAAGLGERFGAGKTERMLHYVQPRGGQIQRRFDAEIPAGLTHDKILRIAREKAALFERMKLPFLIAVHRPDADNDPRNWHLHLIYFPQPGERGADGAWRFGKASDGVGMLRPGDIAVQLQGADAHAGHTHYERRAGADLRALREAYAAICNSVLEEAGDKRRLDPRSFEAMGIVKRPERHLGGAEARLVFAGVDTPTSRLNAARNWEWMIEQRQREIDRFHARTTEPLDEMREVAEVDGALKRERDRLAADLDVLARDRRELMLLDTRLDIALSSAKRVRNNCETTLERIAAGEADGADVGREDAIRRRLHLAEHHLVEIADAVEPWQRDLEACRRDLERREQALQERVGTLATRAQQAEPAWQDVVRKVRNTKLHVHIVGAGATASARVIGLSPEDQIVLDDPRARQSAQAQLMVTAGHQQRSMDRVLKSVRDKGLVATADASAGRSGNARAEANLLRRYRSHPYLVALLDRADRAWSERAIREMEATSRRVAAMVSRVAARPSTSTRPTLDVATKPDRTVETSPGDRPAAVAGEALVETAPVMKTEAAVKIPERAAHDRGLVNVDGDQRDKGETTDIAVNADRGPVRAETDDPVLQHTGRSSSGRQVEVVPSDAAPLIRSVEADGDKQAPGASRENGGSDVEAAPSSKSPEAVVQPPRDAAPAVVPAPAARDEPAGLSSLESQAGGSPDAAGPSEGTAPQPPLPIPVHGEVAKPEVAMPRRDEQVASPSQPFVSTATSDIGKGPPRADPEGAEPQKPLRRSLMDIAREGTAGRKRNPATGDLPAKPNGPPRSLDAIAPRSPASPVKKRTDRSPASPGDEDWLSQQMAWKDLKGPKGR